MQPSADAYQGLLPDRATWFGLCHDWRSLCPECLRRIADFLAEEMGYDVDEALNRPAESYRAELGPVCTMEQARDLRRRVVKACYPIWFDEPVVVADEDYAEAQAA